MSSEKIPEQPQRNVPEQKNKPVPNANEISHETMVNILVNKGICTTDEILSLEEKIRYEKSIEQDFSFVNVKNSYDRGRFPGLKRAMSKHRWSRKVGTFLFGWKWKKIRKNPTFS